MPRDSQGLSLLPCQNIARAILCTSMCYTMLYAKGNVCPGGIAPTSSGPGPGHIACQSCDRLITTGMSGAVVPLLQTGGLEALQLLTELGKRSLEMPAPGENAIWARGIANLAHLVIVMIDFGNLGNRNTPN